MIVREGFAPIIVVAAVALTITAAGYVLWALPLWALAAYLARVFRKPRPTVSSHPAAVVSPVTGRVVEVARGSDPWLERDVLRLSIAIGAPGITALLSPVEGQVMRFWTKAGAFGVDGRTAPDAGSPDCYARWVQTDEGDDVVYAVSSRYPVSRCRFKSSPGERVGLGHVAGFIYFATSVDVLVSDHANSRVRVGDRVESGGTLAELVRD